MTYNRFDLCLAAVSIWEVRLFPQWILNLSNKVPPKLVAEMVVFFGWRCFNGGCRSCRLGRTDERRSAAVWVAERLVGLDDLTSSGLHVGRQCDGDDSAAVKNNQTVTSINSKQSESESRNLALLPAAGSEEWATFIRWALAFPALSGQRELEAFFLSLTFLIRQRQQMVVDW